MQTRECRICHRLGWRAFVPYGDSAWRCTHEGACARRQGAAGYDRFGNRSARSEYPGRQARR